jgi:beta-mannanase
MRWRRLGRTATIAALAGAAVGLVGFQFGIVGRERAASYRPWVVPPHLAARVDVGVTTLPLARNSWRAWRASDLETVNGFEHAIRKHVSVVMWYTDWANGKISLTQLKAVASRGSIPEITWEPWNSLARLHRQPQYRLRSIIAGRFDPYIRASARVIARFGAPVRLRFAQEMNGNWYPWSERWNGNRLHDFARAWRHVHDIFRAAGATNVVWVWSPAAISIPREEFPGDAYVSMVSLSVFNGGAQLRYGHWKPFNALVSRALARLHAIAPRKPIELSEIGCAPQGGDKAAWIAGMFSALKRYPAISSIVWYDLVKGSDWRVESSRETAAAFAAGVSGARYR